MNPPPSTSPLLDQASADFIQRYTSIHVAARDAQNIPTIARAFGCGVSADRRTVTVYLAPLRATAVLNSLRDNGAIAVVVSRPSSHESLQLKGTVSAITSISKDDRAIIMDYLHSLTEDLTGIGYKPGLVDSFMPEVNDDCLAVSFQPAALFVQTPGPRAGQRLEPGA